MHAYEENGDGHKERLYITWSFVGKGSFILMGTSWTDMAMGEKFCPLKY